MAFRRRRDYARLLAVTLGASALRRLTRLFGYCSGFVFVLRILCRLGKGPLSTATLLRRLAVEKRLGTRGATAREALHRGRLLPMAQRLALGLVLALLGAAERERRGRWKDAWCRHSVVVL